MKYIDFLNVIISGVTYLTLTGLTDVVYIKCTLEDSIELDPNTYPGTTQIGKSVFLCPVPMTLNSDDIMIYSTRIYIAQQIKEDSSDRFTAFSSCIELCNMLVDFFKDYDTLIIQYPLNITPVLMFDATVDGIFFDLNVMVYLTECYNI